MGALKSLGRSLRDVQPVSYQDAFLIGDLLTSYITLCTGEPKAGKTLLSAGISSALLSGASDFCGYPIHRKVDRIVYGLTDEGADGELRERFTDDELDRITVFPIRHASDPSYWRDLAGDLVETQAGVFVLDNILGSLGATGDISDPVTAQVIVENLRQIAGAGVPVLAITHTPKGSVDGLSSASSPIGGRAIAAGARGIITLRKDRNQGLRIVVNANRARNDGIDVPVGVAFAEGSEVPTWSRRAKREPATSAGEPKKQSRKAETLNKAGEAVRLILEEQPPVTSISALARDYGPRVGMPENTLRLKLGSMVVRDRGEWSRSGAS